MKLFGLGWIAGLSVATFIVGWFMGRRARRLELEHARRKAMLAEHDFKRRSNK